MCVSRFLLRCIFCVCGHIVYVDRHNYMLYVLTFFCMQASAVMMETCQAFRAMVYIVFYMYRCLVVINKIFVISCHLVMIFH